jgi:hypothetical protein
MIKARSIGVHGISKTVAEWAEIYHVDRYLIYNRLKNGLKENEKLFIPPNSHRSKRPGTHGGSI